MRPAHIGLIATIGLLANAACLAADSADKLAAKNNCLACHQIDKKVVGPSYKEVAAKYKGDKSAESKLIEKVKKGGTGVWGNIPMPAQNVKDDELKSIVKWILSQ